MIAKVLVDIKNQNVNKLYDYAIPKEMEELIEVGLRVVVPFGNRKIMGFVIQLDQTSDYHQPLKDIEAILDVEPMVTKELIELAYELEETTSASLAHILETIIPSALKVVYKTYVFVIEPTKLSKSLMNQIGNRNSFEFTKDYYPFMKEIKVLCKLGYLRLNYDIKTKSEIKKNLVVQFVKRVPKLTEKQGKVLDYLEKIEGQKEKLSVLMKNLEITSSVFSSLEKKECIVISNEEIYREVSHQSPLIDKRITLNEEQQLAYRQIHDALGTNQVFLLHGITGSGKTEVYLKMIEDVVQDGKQALFLVPEIALTPMMIQRLKGRFSSDVAVLHSALSIGEKYDEWRRIIRGEVHIVIGARSACFAPLTNIGIMIIDECHESTYKQEETPSYYAIDVLERRNKTHQCPLILGSATPNIETYARYKRGYYQLLTLNHRAMNSFEPDMELIDMKNEFKNGNTGVFSRRLLEEIKVRLEKKEQVLLLLNRRGYSNFVMCRNCGYVFKCPNCDISLTYHEVDHSCKCHYCGYKESVPHECKKCQSTDLVYYGYGTQKIEETLKESFPESHIVRMDNDTTRTKNAHEKLLISFEEQGDILLGTQMIAKGLDFPRVTLVGILQADGNLFSPDFRAPEKTFQLIMQVAGRSGRHDLKGKVIVQAFNTEHYAIHFALKNDYLSFYEYEMNIRKITRYAPFYFIHKIEASGENMRELFALGYQITKEIKSACSRETIVLGPTLPKVSKIKGRNRCEILIKYRNEPLLDQTLKKIITEMDLGKYTIRIDRFPSI